MEYVYLIVVGFLLLLAVFDLFAGVSNDAVNFMNSAIGAKVARFKTIMIVATAGVLVGALMSSGMMDVARNGILQPASYTFHEVMIVFLAAMVADVIILDVFNTLGMPTSTTVSLVFELLGATFILALIKMAGDDTLTFDMLLNSDKALSVTIAIFVSVAIAFFFGIVVQWISRLIFTFNYKKNLHYTIGVFGGVAFTFLSYFIFIKGLKGSPFVPEEMRAWINTNTSMLLAIVFIASTILMQLLHFVKVNVFKIIVLMGTFALAMAFASNDLVNFIGMPLAGLDAYLDYSANGNNNPDSYMMTSLMTSAKTPLLYLTIAGVIMIIAMATSKKAQNVVKTSVDLSRQDEGDEMFGSSKAARSIVRMTQDGNSKIVRYMPKRILKWIDGRFCKEEAIIADGAAFDVIRASVNLVLAATLIVIGTNYKLPLSTTYVTFMVAMGSSLADRAWSRESAVFRVTGVLSVIGGWFITGGAAFAVGALVCTIMYYGGFVAMFIAMAIVVYIFIQSNVKAEDKSKSKKGDDVFRLMMRARDPEIVWDLLQKHVSRTQSFVNRFAFEQYNKILDGLAKESISMLGKSHRELRDEQEQLKKFRRKELLAFRRVPVSIAVERNTWYHLGVNSDEQFIYCLKRMLEPIKEHVDNNFNPLPQLYVDELAPIRKSVAELMGRTEKMLSSCDFTGYEQVLVDADKVKDELSVIRKRHYDRMHSDHDDKNIKISLVYLNIIQETQEFLSIMRHQLRAGSRFFGNL
jgi:phosphate/sulfate permease